MLPNPKAFESVIDFLNKNHIPYMVIGGMANSIWGRVRATHDADFKVGIDMPLADFRRMVLEHFPARQTNIPAQKLSPHIVHIWATPDVPADLLVCIFDYERQAIDRATEMILDGVPARVCTAEDLLIHKVVASRGNDWRDVEGILIRQKNNLDMKYVRHWLKEFAEGLENPELLAHFEKLYSEVNS